METKNDDIANNKRKRRLSSDDGECSLPKSKILHFVENETKEVKEDEPEIDHQTELMSLSDEILLEILKNVFTWDLISLSKTCSRMDYLICDKRLWIDVDLSTKSLSASELCKIFKYLHAETKSVSIKGLVSLHPLDKWNNTTLTQDMMKKFNEKCSLESFKIYEGFIDADKVTITNFPKTLKSLVFNNCGMYYVKFPKTFFAKMDQHLTNLEELSLENCNWFETHDLIGFSKLTELKILNLKGCKSMKECVPYGSIATRFGFKKLQKLDIRDTPVSDSDIQCFNTTVSLRELLMDCPENLRKKKIQNDSRSANIFEPLFNRNIPLEAENRIFILDRENAQRFFSNSGQDRDDRCLEINPVWPGLIPINNDSTYETSEESDEDDEPGTGMRVCGRKTLISDRGICSFGLARNNVQNGLIWIRAEYRSPDTFLEKISVKNYRLVTDTALKHLASCSPNLNMLDVTGTSVTREGVSIFKSKKTNCVVLSDFDLN